MSNFEGTKLTRHPLAGIAQMAAVMPVTASAADATRADNALAYYLMQFLRVAVVREMADLQSHRSDLAPFALATWCSFFVLDNLPHLRMQARFPATMAWIRSMVDQTSQLVGATCLHESLGTPRGYRCWSHHGAGWSTEATPKTRLGGPLRHLAEDGVHQSLVHDPQQL